MAAHRAVAVTRLTRLLLLLLLLGAAAARLSGLEARASLPPGEGGLRRAQVRSLRPKKRPAARLPALPGAEERVGAYLNQLSLQPEGHLKCGVASVVMLLALTGRVARDTDTLAAGAAYLWEMYGAPTGVRTITKIVDDQGLAGRLACMGPSEAWARLTKQVDAGYPGLILTTRLTKSGSGHYVVFLGYREQEGRRQVLVYDPYGRWRGPGRGYRRNDSTVGSRGEAVYYDFEAAWGYHSERCPQGYLLTVGAE